MSSYRLLRSNKEIGPYSLEELLSLGLKPYDLIWVDGKSAAWRYPSEIHELKAYAPAVEEQPYDRFYKRGNSEQQESKPITEVTQTPGTTTQETKVSVQETATTTRTKAPVFISMPQQEKPRVLVIGKKEPPVKQEKPKVPATTASGLPEKPLANTPAPSAEVETNFEESKKSFLQSSEPALETKYEKSLEEIKEMYVKSLIDRKEKFSRKKRLAAFGKKGMIALYIVLLGGLVAMTVTRKAEKTPLTNRDSYETSNPVSVPSSPEIALENPAEQQENAVSDPAEHTGLVRHTESGKSSSSENMEDGNKDTPTEQGKSRSPFPVAPTGTETDENGVRKAVNREEKTAAKKTTNLRDMVSLKANEYKRAAFGGIKDLELTIANNSPYILDKVLVELDYLKPSELPLKTEIVEFNTVSPHGSMTIKIPDSNRGIKVVYRISKVLSSEMNDEVARNK